MLNTLVRWERILLQPSFFRKLHPLGKLRDFGIFVDASMSWGIGIVIGECWYVIPLRDNLKRAGIDICWLEAVVLEPCFLFPEQLVFKDIHVLVRSDNKGAICALTKARSPNFDINLCARRSFAANGCGITTKIMWHRLIISLTRPRVVFPRPSLTRFASFVGRPSCCRSRTCRSSGPSLAAAHCPTMMS
jgi:hypothetical protein